MSKVSRLGGNVDICVTADTQKDELSVRIIGDIADIAIILAATARNNPQFQRAIKLAQIIQDL